MKTLLKTLWLAIAATTLAACQNPAPDPAPPTPTPTKNSMVYGAAKIDFKSIIVDDKVDPEVLTIFASPEAGITTAEEMARKNGNDFVHKFVTIMLPPENLNKTIDVKGTDQYLFGNYSTICPEIKEITPGATPGISAGTIKTTWSAGNAIVVDFDLTVTSSGNHWTGNITAPYTPAPMPKITNAIEFDGADKTEFQSIVFYEDYTKLYIYASARSGIRTIEAMQNVPHLMVMVGYNDMNRTINVMTEQEAIFGMANQTGIGSEITACGNGMYPDIKAGTFKYAYDRTSGAFAVTMSLTAKTSGKILNANIEGTYAPKPVGETDIMKYNADNFPILVKYYEPTELGTKFYVSPFETPASEIASCAHVAKIFVGTAYIDGEKHDITKLTDGFGFAYFNIISSVDVLIKAGDLKGATGNFSVVNNGGGNFTLEYQITIGGNVIYGQAENLFTKIEPASDYQTYWLNNDGIEDKAVPMKSIVLDKTANGGANWDIYISSIEGITTVEGMNATEKLLVLRTKESLMTGKQISFSNNADISITYDKKIYNQASGADGYLQGAFAEGMLSITFVASTKTFLVDGMYEGTEITVIE